MPNRRKMFLVFSVVMAAILGSLLAAAPAQAAANYRNVVNFGSDKCLDVRTQDNITVQLFSCNGNDNKRFDFQAWSTDSSGNTLFRIHPKSNPGNCVWLTNPTNAVGTAVISSFCDTRPNERQLWRLVGHSINGQTWNEIQNFASALCITVRGGSGANGTIIEQNACTSTPADLWRI